MNRRNVRQLYAALFAAAFVGTSSAHAEDTLKLTIGQTLAWAQQPPILGQQAGIFKKHGLNLNIVATQGAGETLQPVISGAVDIGIGIGTVGVMRAFARGAPVRIFGASFTGMGDIFWYVKADSPIKKLSDLTDKNTIAYSTNGATSHSVVLAFKSELGAKGRPTATGGPPSTLTEVMSGQVDVGWSVPPFGLKEVADGKIRIIARGSDVPSMQDQTVRVQAVNAKFMTEHRDAFLRFVSAYREALDWIFSPAAYEAYSKKNHIPLNLVKQTAEQFQTRKAMQFDKISGVDAIMSDGVKLKFLDALLTKQQLGELIRIPKP